jgi:hypothetical protein
MAQVRRGLTEFRGSYYQDEGWTRQVGGREVAVFSISGWTDDLFEPIESFRQFKYLKRLDPLWPVALAVADVGHSRAQNKPATWHRLNDQAFQFLQAHIAGSHRQQTTVYSEPTICPSSGAPGNDSDASERLTALTPESLSQGTLSIAYTRGDALTFHSGLADPNGPATDPVVGGVFDPLIAPNDGGCRTSPGPPPDAYSGVSDALPSARTYIGLGYVRVPYTYTGTTAQLDARVWDVVPGGPTLLVTRGAYRLTSGYDAPAGTLRVPLFGNHWLLLPGHRIRLDLLQVDQPYLRPSNVPSTITFQAPRLVLPTLEAIQQVLSGD